MIFSQIRHGLLLYESTSYLLIHLFIYLITSTYYPPTRLPFIYLPTVEEKTQYVTNAFTTTYDYLVFVTKFLPF
jgi:hypothetical protein